VQSKRLLQGNSTRIGRRSRQRTAGRGKREKDYGRGICQQVNREPLEVLEDGGGSMTTEGAKVSPKELLREHFEMTPEQFAEEWAKLTTRDKLDLSKGIRNGSLTY